MNQADINHVKTMLWNHYKTLLARAKQLHLITETQGDYTYHRNRRGTYIIDQTIYTRQEIHDWTNTYKPTH